MYRNRPQRRAGGGNVVLYVLALHAASRFMRLPRKPPVTASLILVNTVVYWRPGFLDAILPTVNEVCLSPYRVIRDWDAKRLFLSAFYHVDDAHLVYNMVSLLWKGAQLETSMGSAKFAVMVTAFLGMSHGLVVLSAKLLAMYGHTPGPMYSQCAVGFSAVLFAMKVVLNWDSPDSTDIYGILIPSRYAAWAELFLIQLLVPGTSFLGHLCGIFAGLIYVNSGALIGGRHNPFVLVGRLLQRPLSLVLGSFLFLFGCSGALIGERHNPFVLVGRLLQRPLSLVLWLFSFLFGWRRRGRIYGHGTAGYSNRIWRCRVCTFDNGGLREDCETCGSPRGTSTDSPPEEPGPTAPPSVEELRRARLARFNNAGSRR